MSASSNCLKGTSCALCWCERCRNFRDQVIYGGTAASKKRKRMPSYERYLFSPVPSTPRPTLVVNICGTCGEARDNGPSSCDDACDGPGGEGCECYHHNGSPETPMRWLNDSPAYVPTSPCTWFEPGPYSRNGCLSPIWDAPAANGTDSVKPRVLEPLPEPKRRRCSSV